MNLDIAHFFIPSKGDGGKYINPKDTSIAVTLKHRKISIENSKFLLSPYYFYFNGIKNIKKWTWIRNISLSHQKAAS